MRILHYSQVFSVLSETFIYDYVLELEKNGVENHVLTNRRVNPEERPFEKVHVTEEPPRWDAGRLMHRAWKQVAGEPTHTCTWPRLRKRMTEVIDNVQPAVIHAHFGPEGVIVAPVAEKLGVPLVVHFRGYDLSRLLPSPFWEREYKKLFTQAKALIGISNYICSKLIALQANEEKVRLLHTGVRIAEFEFDPPSGRFDGRVVRCLHVGRLTEKKSPLKLVRAFHRARQLVKGRLELQLEIVGDGSLRDPLEKLVQNLRLNESVHLLGARPHEQVIQLMRKAHLHTKHCLTASDGDQEGQGVTFAEASAVGLPIVTTRHNGIPDVVKDGVTGYLVPEGDVEAMAKRIAHLALHPEEWDEMGRAGRNHITTHFDLLAQTKKLIGIYEQICERVPTY